VEMAGGCFGLDGFRSVGLKARVSGFQRQ
jgi:hypothetical protein